MKEWREKKSFMTDGYAQRSRFPFLSRLVLPYIGKYKLYDHFATCTSTFRFCLVTAKKPSPLKQKRQNSGLGTKLRLGSSSKYLGLKNLNFNKRSYS